MIARPRSTRADRPGQLSEVSSDLAQSPEFAALPIQLKPSSNPVSVVATVA